MRALLLYIYFNQEFFRVSFVIINNFLQQIGFYK